MENCFVYEHWRLDRDECFHVGMGRQRSRPYDMKKRNRHHKAIVAKAFREGFAIEVRIVKTGLTWEEAGQLEIERIAFWKTHGCDLANIAAGGCGCVLHGAANPQFGKPSGFRGKRLSDSAKEKIRKKMLGNKNQRNHIYKKGASHPFSGKKHSEESKRKISNSCRLRFARKLADRTDRADAVQTVRPTLAQEV